MAAVSAEMARVREAGEQEVQAQRTHNEKLRLGLQAQ